MHWLALLLLGLPFASYWIHLFCYAANAPFIDDYEVILGSTNHFITTPGLLGKVGALIAVRRPPEGQQGKQQDRRPADPQPKCPRRQTS